MSMKEYEKLIQQLLQLLHIFLRSTCSHIWIGRLLISHPVSHFSSLLLDHETNSLDTVLFVKGISLLRQETCHGVERKSIDQACASIPCRDGMSRPRRCAGASRALTPHRLHGQKRIRLMAGKTRSFGLKKCCSRCDYKAATCRCPFG